MSAGVLDSSGFDAELEARIATLRLLIERGAASPDAALGALDEAITQIREALARRERAQKQAEEQLQCLMNASDSFVYMCTINPPHTTTWMSSNTPLILGYQPHELINNPTLWTSALHPEDAPRVLDELVGGLARALDGEEFVHEYRIRHRAGYYCWIRDTLKLSHQSGFLIGSRTNITSQRRAEEEAEQRVHRATALLRTMVASTPVVLFALDTRGLFTMLEGRELRRLGLRSEQLIGTSALRMFADISGFVSAYRRALAGKTTASTFHLESATFEMFYAPTLHIDGQVNGMIGIGFDVTEWHTVQRTLSKTEKRLTEVLRLACIGVWELDLKTKHLWWSSETYQIHGIDPHTPATQDMFMASVHPDDREAFNAAYQALFAAGRHAHDFRITLPSGELRHIRSNAWIIPNEAGEPAWIAGINQDVTQQALAEKQIIAQLCEKDTLLREIHHRVKNNLQIIASLLHFQAKKMPDQSPAFAELRQRLFAMTLVHEKLYQSKQLSKLALGDYVQGLVGALTNSLDTRKKISVRVSCDEISLPIELALPCGMILCELLTNVFKYAFPHAQTGHATVKTLLDNDHVLLEVCDDGVGLPPHFDPLSSGSFGWELIRTLVAQLDGHLETQNHQGLRVHVRFPLPA